MKVFFCVHEAISLCRSGPCCARREGRGRKSTPLASRLQNPPDCAISLLIPGGLELAHTTCVWQRLFPPDGGKGLQRQRYCKFDYGFCCALWAILRLAVSFTRSSTFVHSRRSLLAKRKIATHHCAKSSSTMPGIFFTTFI